MGSAFPAEPLYGQRPEDVVTMLTFGNDDTSELVVHLAHHECAFESPHTMNECGRFQSASRSPKTRKT